ncbi:hypothetical protein [Rheinheimera sp.]|uniref:hypothetical protein n=1 Tax=Rheinheimera sp. TaxID=1869214 RepID=UPI00307DCE21
MNVGTSLFDTLIQIRQQAQVQGETLSQKYRAIYQDKLKEGQGSTAANPSVPAEDNAASKKLDFSQIQRGQAQQWLDKQVQAGTLTQSEITAMRTLLFTGSTDSSDREAAGKEQLDLLEKAKTGLRAAILRKDSSGMAFWAQALGAMKKFQGEVA